METSASLDALLNGVGYLVLDDSSETYRFASNVQGVQNFALQPLDERLNAPGLTRDDAAESLKDAETNALSVLDSQDARASAYGADEEASYNAHFTADGIEEVSDEDVGGDIAEYFGLGGAIMPQELAMCLSVENQEDEEEQSAALSAEDQRLAELLGRRPSSFDHDEYYWEEVDEFAPFYVEKKESNAFVRTIFGLVNVLVAPPIFVGRTTISICRTLLGSDLSRGQHNRGGSRVDDSQPVGRFSDMMISTAAGVLIAVCIVFPTLKLFVQEIVSVVTESKVRSIGESVPISPNNPETDILPFLSERMLYPHYEAVELAPGGYEHESLENLEDDGYPMLVP